MKKLLAAALALCLALSALPALGEKRDALPDCLVITQKLVRTNLSAYAYVDCTYPQTANKQVNEAMAALVDELAARNQEKVPLKRGTLVAKGYLDVGATVGRTGDRWASFLTVARVASEREQIAVDYETRVYDMLTGERVGLTDLFDDASPAWELLACDVRTQLTAYFAEETPDGAALDALCAKEALQGAAFTLGAAWITLTYRADALYPGKNTLMHVRADYGVYRPLMTERAFAQTDMSGYKMIALTYDDGPSRGITLQLQRVLRAGCAGATFFMVGKRMAQSHDVICAAQDALHCLASHNYEHVWGKNVQGNVIAYRERFARELDGIAGVVPRIMRAPGGNEEVFIAEDVGLPLIHWNLIANDASGIKNVRDKARTLSMSVSDGAILLMHDMTTDTADCTQLLLAEIAKRGYLCVTVEELFAAAGIPLLPNTVYDRVRPEEQ